MPAREVRTYTAKEIERLGENYLEGHFGSAVPVPVDVDFLVEKSEGIDLDFYPKLRANYGILGGVWRDVDTGELFIYIDEDLENTSDPLDSLPRFCAWLLLRAILSAGLPLGDNRSPQGDNIREGYADAGPSDTGVAD